MAKQGSIKHYRQIGSVKNPPSLPYGELAVAKDGTLYVGGEANTAVEQAKASHTHPHTHTPEQVGALPVGGKAADSGMINGVALRVSWNASSGTLAFTL